MPLMFWLSCLQFTLDRVEEKCWDLQKKMFLKSALAVLSMSHVLPGNTQSRWQWSASQVWFFAHFSSITSIRLYTLWHLGFHGTYQSVQWGEKCFCKQSMSIVDWVRLTSDPGWQQELVGFRGSSSLVPVSLVHSSVNKSMDSTVSVGGLCMQVYIQTLCLPLID